MSATLESILAKLYARRAAARPTVQSSVRLHQWSGHYRGVATHNAKLSEIDVVRIRQKHRAGSTTRQLAAQHGVHHTAIWYAVTKRPMLLKCGRLQWRYYTWNHVTEDGG